MAERVDYDKQTVPTYPTLDTHGNNPVDPDFRQVTFTPDKTKDSKRYVIRKNSSIYGNDQGPPSSGQSLRPLQKNALSRPQ